MSEKVVVGGKLVDVSEVVLPPLLKKKRRGNRARFEIICDTLLFIQNSGEVVKTRVMYGVVLNFTQLEEILDQLIRQGLIKLRKEGRRSYLTITDKGKQALKLGKEFLSIIGER